MLGNRAHFDRLDKLAREIIAAFREDRDADLHNLVDGGLADDPLGLVMALARNAAPLRFIATDGQAFYAQRDGKLFGFWLEGESDRWEASELKYVTPTLGSGLGYEIAHEELPDWLPALVERVLADLGGPAEE